jgi:hypothetical protein
MSRVAAAALIGLGFLSGCKETPPQTMLHVIKESNPCTQTIDDIIIINDPNDLIALNNFPREIQADAHPQSEIEYFIIPFEPRPSVDCKIIAVKPDPNIDYMILNAGPKSQAQIMELRRQLQEAHQKQFKKQQDCQKSPK